MCKARFSIRKTFKRARKYAVNKGEFWNFQLLLEIFSRPIREHSFSVTKCTFYKPERIPFYVLKLASIKPKVCPIKSFLYHVQIMRTLYLCLTQCDQIGQFIGLWASF